jgi:hypothetical protein
MEISYLPKFKLPPMEHFEFFPDEVYELKYYRIPPGLFEPIAFYVYKEPKK